MLLTILIYEDVYFNDKILISLMKLFFLDADLLTFNYTTLLIAVFTSWVWNDHRA